LVGESRSTLGGVLGGVDATFRNLGPDGMGGITVGALAGFSSMHARLTTTSTSINPANVGNGLSSMVAHLEGPSAGAYGTYFNGPFSADATFRADFLSLSESFTDIQAFTANVIGGVPFAARTSVFTGTGSTHLNNYTTTANVNYRVALAPAYWVEPTAGVQFTASDYDSSAALLGLSNGHLFRVQAGARFGIDSIWNGMHLTTTITGLAYDNVSVTGGFIQNVAFGNNALIFNDQGKLRGQGILAFNLDHGGGVSTFAQGEIRGGEGLFGAGGKAGVRYQW